MRKNAFCTFIMKNDSFAPGILTFAYSIRKQRLNADLICIATKDVSEDCIFAFRQLYDFVFVVDQLYVNNNNKQQRQDRNYLFARFSILKVLEKRKMFYDRVIICDADLLPLRNYRDLLNVPAPSGILNECKENVIGPSTESDSGDNWIWHDVYKDIPHMAAIPKEITDRVRYDKNNLGVNACIYILNHEVIKYQDIVDDLDNEETMKIVENFSWPEMQYLTMKLSGLWHNIDLKYASFNSYPNLHAIYGTHYAGLKPWNIKNESYLHYCKHDDYKLWICIFLNMIKSNKNLLLCNEIKKIFNFLVELVSSDKQYVLSVKDYPEYKYLIS